jgi:hypothetical protein
VTVSEYEGSALAAPGEATPSGVHQPLCRHLSNEPSEEVGEAQGVSGRALPELESPSASRGGSNHLDQRGAWFGSHGSAVSAALSLPVSGRGATKASAMVSEIVIADDDRIQITDTLSVPFRWICRLSILAANGTRWNATGWFAAPGLVVTAGHCVYLHNQGGWARAIEVQPMTRRTRRTVPPSSPLTGG